MAQRNPVARAGGDDGSACRIHLSQSRAAAMESADHDRSSAVGSDDPGDAAALPVAAALAPLGVADLSGVLHRCLVGAVREKSLGECHGVRSGKTTFLPEVVCPRHTTSGRKVVFPDLTP